MGVLLTVSLAAVPSASGAPVVRFIVPAGSHVYPDHSVSGPFPYTEAPTAVRTTDPRPTFGLQADGGAGLHCYLDNIQITPTPCGSPLPGCPTTLCGSFKPSAPLGPDSSQFSPGHFLAVDVVDSDGMSVLSQMWLNIDVDITPPHTSVDNARGLLTLDDNRTRSPLRPSFTFRVTDSNSVGGNVDTASCSWSRATASSAFRPCVEHPGSNSFSPGALAKRHRLYRLEVRGTDDFGRSTTAGGLYDPIPCSLSIRHPANLASLLSSGVKTQLHCDAIRQVAVAVYAFMVNGRKGATPRGAVSDNPVLGEYNATGRAGTINLSKRLKLSGDARSALRSARSIGLVIAAGDHDKVVAGIADDSLSYQVLTLRRSG